nr:MAG TPA: hypothetical protein [Caudoviricetes sp.]
MGLYVSIKIRLYLLLYKKLSISRSFPLLSSEIVVERYSTFR